MNCDDTRRLIHAYLDGELDLVRTMEIEAHLRECPACAREHATYAALSSAIKAHGSLYYPLPAGLPQRVDDVVAKTGPLVVKRRALELPSRWINFAGIAAALAFFGILFWFFGSTSSRPQANALLAQEITSEHVRSLMANHLTDVLSSDQHTVKPWFSGKLDFSPQVKDLSKQGFILVGGRLDYIQDRSVAALVYQRRQHVINLFVWPSAKGRDQAAQKIARKGYTLVHWTQSGMFYCAISDLNDRELGEFAQLVRADANSM